MVLDSISASYIGWSNPALSNWELRIMITSAAVANFSLFTFHSSLFDNAKVRRLSYTSKFWTSIWTVFQHEFAQFSRTVFSSPRIRNFVPFEITFRRLRAGWRYFQFKKLFELFVRHKPIQCLGLKWVDKYAAICCTNRTNSSNSLCERTDR